MSNLLLYDTPEWLTAFTTGKDSGVEELGLAMHDLALPRQTHSSHVQWMHTPGRPEDTDAVITDTAGLCLCVKTADCIPVLLYDDAHRVIAAVHAGWRGTVARIVEKTLAAMPTSAPARLHAIIGPGISRDAFEVGEEVYDAFRHEQFPMERIARRYPHPTDGERWHIDLWDANRWVLEQCGVQDIRVQGTCTVASARLYSARRETIHTGRNLNGIMIRG